MSTSTNRMRGGGSLRGACRNLRIMAVKKSDNLCSPSLIVCYRGWRVTDVILAKGFYSCSSVVLVLDSVRTGFIRALVLFMLGFVRSRFYSQLGMEVRMRKEDWFKIGSTAVEEDPTLARIEVVSSGSNGRWMYVGLIAALYVPRLGDQSGALEWWSKMTQQRLQLSTGPRCRNKIRTGHRHLRNVRCRCNNANDPAPLRACDAIG